MKHAFFFLCYRRLLWPLLYGAFRLVARTNAKVRQGLEMRNADSSGRPPWLNALPSGQRPIWIHCASMELEYAKPVITAIKERQPAAKILITYFSPSVAQAAARFPGVDAACPSPWENAATLQAFLEHHQPQMLLLARTDTWPEMLRQTHLKGIPSLLFSATLARDSGRARGLGRWLSKIVFSDLSQIFCVSEEDRAVFADLGCEDKVRVAGDTRYDQVQARLDHPKPVHETLFNSQADAKVPILVAGSTWEEDETVLIETMVKLKTGPRLKWILVPHEPTPEHLEKLEDMIERVGFRSIRYSQAQAWPSDEVLLIDQIGILAELYLKGQLAFVGGSFKKTVHSVMEPLAAGCVTFVGPLHANNREALEFRTLPIADSSGLTMVQPVRDAEEFAHQLSLALTHLSHDTQSSIRHEIQNRSGKSELVAKWALERWAP